jgi:hypothetical protein
MSTKAQAKTQVKTPAAPAAAHIPQPPVAELEHEAERPDIVTQLDNATRLGHRFGALGVDHSPPPIIQRQEIPEVAEEELQMRSESAALQRQELPEEDEELMMKPAEGRVGPQGGQVPPEVEAAINRARGGGQPLDGALQEQMSASLGYDFSGVRVHTDAEADALNQQLTARAFTTGRDIFFRQGEYNPGADSGRELISHELTHVVQQRTGRVGAESSGMAVRPVGDAFEQEADEMGSEANHEIKNGSQQRATSKASWPSPADVEALQNTIGNRAVMLSRAKAPGNADAKRHEKPTTVQRACGDPAKHGETPQNCHEWAISEKWGREKLHGLRAANESGSATGSLTEEGWYARAAQQGSDVTRDTLHTVLNGNLVVFLNNNIVNHSMLKQGDRTRREWFGERTVYHKTRLRGLNNQGIFGGRSGGVKAFVIDSRGTTSYPGWSKTDETLFLGASYKATVKEISSDAIPEEPTALHE